MAAFSKKKRYLVGMLVLVLIISIALNLYDYFVILPKMQATMNDMRVQAFGSWLSDMNYAAYVLEVAESREDFHQVEYHLDNAMWSVATLRTGIDTGYYPEQYTTNLYYWIHRATDSLDYAVERVLGLLYYNSSGLDQYIRLRIESITQGIHNMSRSLRIQRWVNTGVEPVQQLEDEGTLADVMNYCKQIHESSIEITDYVRDKLQ